MDLGCAGTSNTDEDTPSISQLLSEAPPPPPPTSRVPPLKSWGLDLAQPLKQIRSRRYALPGDCPVKLSSTRNLCGKKVLRPQSTVAVAMRKWRHAARLVGNVQPKYYSKERTSNHAARAVRRDVRGNIFVEKNWHCRHHLWRLELRSHRCRHVRFPPRHALVTHCFA